MVSKNSGADYLVYFLNPKQSSSNFKMGMRWIFFSKILKFKTVLYELALMVFTIFGCLFMKKSKIKFLYASMKSLTICEKPSSNPFHWACSSFLGATCDSKSCSESRLWFWKLFRKPAINVHWRKSTNESKEKPGQKFNAAYGTIFRISKWFKQQAETLHLTNRAKSFNTICSCSESTDLI